ncbi:MAG: thioredoxin domain-containing protein [Anaerolineae bacterium]|nr:thioredoxin domain-containing protein [Anaerolineae bacterium]
MLRFMLVLFVCCVLITSCAPAAETPTTTPDFTPVPSLTPTAPVASEATADDPYANLPQTATGLGFPQLGFPNALVSVVVFTAFDCTACMNEYRQTMPIILQHVRNGEALLTLVPLTTGELPNGEPAARAALCANDQSAFWRYVDLLYGWLEQFGAEAFSTERLVSGVTDLGLDRAAWDTCMLSTRPGNAISSAIASSQSQTGFAGAPTIFVNAEPVENDVDSIDAAIRIEIARADAAIQAALDATNTPSPDSTFDPAATEPIVITLPPVQNQEIPPPLEMTLPDGWRVRHDTLLLGDVDAMRSVPFSYYTGPVTGGTGSIVLLWGFPNLVAGNPFDTSGLQVDLFTDGLRLLRLAVIEQGCNIGTDLRREYSIGGLTAVGTQFSAVTCPSTTDTRGWFAGLQQNGINFIFYAFTDPIEAIDGARPELQAILDSVRFAFPTPAATSTETG